MSEPEEGPPADAVDIVKVNPALLARIAALLPQGTTPEKLFQSLGQQWVIQASAEKLKADMAKELGM